MSEKLKKKEDDITTEYEFTDSSEEVYTIRHHKGSNMIWLHDERERLGLTREALSAFLPLIKRFMETGSLRK
jgi:hypothetical protein